MPPLQRGISLPCFLRKAHGPWVSHYPLHLPGFHPYLLTLPNMPITCLLIENISQASYRQNFFLICISLSTRVHDPPRIHSKYSGSRLNRWIHTIHFHASRHHFGELRTLVQENCPVCCLLSWVLRPATWAGINSEDRRDDLIHIGIYKLHRRSCFCYLVYP